MHPNSKSWWHKMQHACRINGVVEEMCEIDRVAFGEDLAARDSKTNSSKIHHIFSPHKNTQLNQWKR
jgi:hypothetical protein